MRNLLLVPLIASLAFGAAGCQWRKAKKPVEQKPVAAKDYNKPLGAGERALVDVDINTLPNLSLANEDRARLQQAIAHSLAYLNSPSQGVTSANRRYPVGSVTKDQVVQSLIALRELLETTSDEAQFNASLRSRFRALMSVGCDDRGTVLFTGYFTPILKASRTQSGTYRYPIYKVPTDFIKPATDRDVAQQRMPDGSTRPYPTRAELEASGALKGLELLWFSEPYDPYVVEVQGSAKATLPDGTLVEVGVGGINGHPYHPIAQDLVTEGKIRKEDLSLATVRAYFRAHPDELSTYTNRNPRFVFFTQSKGGPYGSLGRPVTSDVTVATDKSIFPPGAACLAVTTAADLSGRPGNYAGLRLDQDAGGGIRAAGRCDLYMGQGDAAEHRAGNQYAEGKLYYLLLK
jgi:membrane-bound lytic murein transglycosylase A